MFTIADGRDRLYQWDSNVKLLLDDPNNEIGEVHIKNRFCRDLRSLEIFRTENETYVKVPDVLLQESYDLIVYAYCYVDNCTKAVEIIEVLDRPKPPDYVYTEEETLHYNLFEERLSRLEKTGGVINGIPSGGKAGQYLRKKSDTDYDVEWSDLTIPDQYGLVTYDQNKTITIT
jgi:hypothetical protein